MHGGAFPGEPAEEGEKEQELNRKLDEVGNDDGERRDEAREVDFSENAGIGHKCGGGFCEASREVVPRSDAGEVEKHGRQAIGRQLGQAAEDYCENESGQDGLDEKPQRAEDGLLVNGDEIATNEHPQEVAVVPDVAQLGVPPTRGGLKDHVPLLGIECCAFHVVKMI
jgi:hypothetical protein